MLIRALGILSLLAPAGLCSIGPTPAGPAAAAVVAAPGGYLGIRASENNGGQVVIDEILAESPAEKSGLKSGDILVAIDEAAVGSVDGLLKALAAKNAGDRVTVKLKRGTETISAVVNLAQRPATLDTTDAPPMAPTERTPMRQSPTAPSGEGSSEQRGWLGVYYDDVPGGVKISSVVDGSPAQAAGLAANDVVTGAGKAVITNSSDLISVLEDLRAGDVVTFTVLRGKDVMDVAVTLGARVDAAMTQPATPAVPSVERTPTPPAVPAAPEIDEPAAGQNAPAGRMNRARRALGRVAQAQGADKGPGLTLAPGQQIMVRAITNADGTTGIEVVNGKSVHAIKVPNKGTRGFTVEREGDGFVLRFANIPSVAPARVRVQGGAGGMAPAEPAPSDEPPAMGGGGMAMESEGATLFAPAEAGEATAFGDMRIATMAVEAEELDDSADFDDLEVIELGDLGDLAENDAGDGTNAIVIAGGPASTTWFSTTDDGVTTVTPAEGGGEFFTVTEGDGEYSMIITPSAEAGDDGITVKKAKASIAKGRKAAKGLRIEANPKAKQAIEKARKAAKARRADAPEQPAKRAYAYAFRGQDGSMWSGKMAAGGPAGMPGGMRWRAMRVPFGGDGPPGPLPPKVIQRANDGSIAVPGYRIAPPHQGAARERQPGPHPRVIIDGDRILIFDRGHGDRGPGDQGHGAHPQSHDIVIERTAAPSECCAGGECCPGGECCEDGACCAPKAKHEHHADVK